MTGGKKKGVEDRGDRLRRSLRDQGGAELERQHRVGLLELGARPVGLGDDAERPELLLDQDLNVVRTDRAAELLGHALGDRRVVATAVDLLGDEVEETRHLNGLAVGAAGDVGRLLEAGLLVLADQLDSRGEARGDRR